MGEFKKVACVFSSALWKGLPVLINHVTFSKCWPHHPSFERTEQRGTIVLFNSQIAAELKPGADLNILLMN